jgi:hypothetical protein
LAGRDAFGKIEETTNLARRLLFEIEIKKEGGHIDIGSNGRVGSSFFTVHQRRNVGDLHLGLGGSDGLPGCDENETRTTAIPSKCDRDSGTTIVHDRRSGREWKHLGVNTRVGHQFVRGGGTQQHVRQTGGSCFVLRAVSSNVKQKWGIISREEAVH